MKTIIISIYRKSLWFQARKWTPKGILYAEDMYIWKNGMVEQNLIGTGWGGGINHTTALVILQLYSSQAK